MCQQMWTIRIFLTCTKIETWASLAVQCSSVRCSTVQCSITVNKSPVIIVSPSVKDDSCHKCCTILYRGVQYITVQCSGAGTASGHIWKYFPRASTFFTQISVWYSTAQSNTVTCSTVQYNANFMSYFFFFFCDIAILVTVHFLTIYLGYYKLLKWPSSHHQPLQNIELALQPLQTIEMALSYYKLLKWPSSHYKILNWPYSHNKLLNWPSNKYKLLKWPYSRLPTLEIMSMLFPSASAAEGKFLTLNCLCNKIPPTELPIRKFLPLNCLCKGRI
jgi:hypothetical protein